MYTQKINLLIAIVGILITLIAPRASACSADANWNHFWFKWGPGNTYDAGDPPNGTDQALSPSQDYYEVNSQSAFDAAIQDLKTRNGGSYFPVMHLQPGTYITSGISLACPGFKIKGAGLNPADVTIQLQDSSLPISDGDTTVIIGFSEGQLEVCNLRVDANWNWHSAQIGTSRFKIGGVVLETHKGWVHNVEVIGVGTQGDGTGGPSGEVFAILLSAKRNPSGDWPSYDDGYHLKITDSSVQRVYAVNGGYGTGIAIATADNDSTSLDGRSALVSCCLVYGTMSTPETNGEHQMNAYGAAKLDNPASVLFDYCYAENTTSAFNADSLPTRNVTIQYGNFLVNSGIHVGAPGAPIGSFSNFLIDENTFTLNGPFENPYHPGDPYLEMPNDIFLPYGVYFSGGVSESEIRNNTIGADVLSGIYDPEGYCILIPYSGNYTPVSDIATENGSTYDHNTVHSYYDFYVISP